MTRLKLKTELKPVLDALSEIQEDITVPKNIRNKVREIIDSLNKETEQSIKINKALDELEKIADDANIQPYTRTQVWNIISLLEI